MPELATFALAVAVTILLPGATVLVWLPERRHLQFRGLYALGLGLALHPLLFLVLRLIHVPAAPATLWVLYGAMSAALLWRLRTKIGVLRSGGWRFPASAWPWACVVLGAACFVVRWLAVRHLPVLPGVDSNAHALIGELFLRNRGIPHDYLPFLPLSSYTYHFGVHAGSAAISMIAGLPIHRAQVLQEPFLFALMALTTMVLAKRLTGNRRTAFTSGVLVAFLSPFPAYYVNWGRLPQLGALVLLPLVLGEFLRDRPGAQPMDHVEGDAPPRAANPAETAGKVARFRPLLWILTAGMALTHYRIAIVLFYALVALLLQETIVAGAGRRVEVFFLHLKHTVASFAPSLLLVMPWVPVLIKSFGFDRIGSPAGAALPPLYYYSLDRISGVLSLPITVPFLVLAALGLLLNFVYLRRGFLFLLYWSVLLLAFSHPYKLPLPWSGLVDFVTVLSLLFLPLAIVGAEAVTATVNLVPTRRDQTAPNRRSATAFCSVILVIALIGTMGTGGLVRDSSLYVAKADIDAFEWIEQNIEPDSRFLSPIVVNSSGIIQPWDAGAWLAYFTERRQATPLALYLSETPADPSYESDLLKLVDAVGSLESVSAQDELRLQGVTHIYFGARMEPRVPRPGPDSGYALLYDEGGSSIYEVPARRASPGESA